MTTSRDVRARIIDALRRDLVGPTPRSPADLDLAEEVLPVAPSKWYLTGFLVPFGSDVDLRRDDDVDDGLDAPGEVVDGDDDRPPETSAARKAHFPSSMGLSVLVAPGVRSLEAHLAWGDYLPLDPRDGRRAEPEGAQRAGGGRWRRVPREASLTTSLQNHPTVTLDVPGAPGLKLVVATRLVTASALVPDGTRAVSVFLVNGREPAPDVTRDAAYAFQPRLALRCEAGFTARPDLHGRDSEDWDELVADLQYADAVEHAVGHNVAAVTARDPDGACREVATSWMPEAEVEKVIPRDLAAAELGMEALAAAAADSADTVRARVGPMVAAYAAWIAAARATAPDTARRADTARALLASADRARARIDAGLSALADPLVREAFQRANQAVATAIRQRACHDRPDLRPDAVDAPKWRPFQLAFLLMNLVGTADEDHEDRAVVDLLFFPTGGGKTEAYLGLAAFAMFLRRLRDPSIGSAGVTVLMRYTLRLLTLDQLGRAATLVCAMELMRQEDVERLGPWPFEIGLWVGRATTPNRMGQKGDNDAHSARAKTIAFCNDSGRHSSPIPLENCPWCGARFSKDSFRLLPDANAPTDLRVNCDRRTCRFSARAQPRGLPLLSVDEPIYRRLPAFLIATVDKFASLPWVGEAGALFGRVERHDADGFHGPSTPNVGRPLGGPLPPPSLIIQDELHLISGPLGTMVGLYETAVDHLSRRSDGRGLGPKIVASTATVRRAERQIRGLFGRTAVEVFPPPGPDRRDAFFAVTAPAATRNPRTYLGVAAQGRNQKVVFLRTMLALMAAAQRAWDEAGGARNPRNPADPYMTVLTYFNALRELGGSRRIVEDEVTTRLRDYARRRERPAPSDSPAPATHFADRARVTEPCELTSRVGTAAVSEAKRRLALPFSEKDRIDVALATNMISVGLDISRLGLMVVFGQPKGAAEYIQATSRVGRDDDRPGLVVTLLNVHRPRDRSHYERFAAWHASFYRAVEATSVTPFSPRAIDRGVAAVTVALARLGHPGLTAPRAASKIGALRGQLAFVAEVLSRRAERHDAQLSPEEQEALRRKVRDRVTGLLDAWENIAARKGELQYQREVGVAPPLLFDPLSSELAKQPADAAQFRAGRSMRDVEPTVNLWIQSPDGLAVTEGDAS